MKALAPNVSQMMTPTVVMVRRTDSRIIDWIGICLLTMPIFVPVIKELGYDPVWFGVLFCMNMQVSYLSPPFGPAAFYLKSVAPPGIELHTIFRSVLPFIALQLVGLTLVLLFPGISLWLVR